ncbi:MAG TPA: aldo/keto reductase [Gaiellaceae bacterium]|nr:aldo/keto reductase [Gaiellaceae bacterium]
MEERRLGPVIGLGTWNTFGGDAKTAGTVVGGALAAGCRVFDSSPMYGGAEASLGVALADRRAEATVATKIWAGDVAEGREQYRRQVQWFGRVEIEQIHNLAAWEAQLEWLEQEREDGRVDRLGVTHYSPRAFAEVAEALRTGRFDVVQLPLNPRERESERELLPLAAALGVAVIVMRPLGEGALVRSSPPQSVLDELEVETWAQALLKWALSDERVDVVIPATRSAGRAASNAAAGEPPWFDTEQRRLVERFAA